MKNSAATISPPADFVYARSLRACSGVHAPAASRVPVLIANDETSAAFDACAKRMTPAHWARVSTLWNPGGAVAGAGSSESWK